MGNDTRKFAWVTLICVGFLLGGCADPKTVTVTEYVTHLQHPETLPAPDNPGLSIKVVTSERIASGELPDKAYVGFLYSDWLEFAKWMHEYKAHNDSLKNAVEAYKAQDSRNQKDQ